MRDRAGPGLADAMPPAEPSAATVAAIDPYDDAALAEWHEVERLSVLGDRPDAVLGNEPHRVHQLRQPSSYRGHLLLAARDGGRIVGIADLGWSLRDNLHLGELEIAVLPSHRRRGLGRALYDDAARRFRADGRTTVLGEAHATPAYDGGVRFAEALGFRVVHSEDHLRTTLPMPAARRAELEAVTAVPGTDYEVLTWRDRCPDELLADYARLRTQMFSDVPTGDVDLQPVAVDEERVRAGEEVLARSYHSVVAAARHAGGGLAGYSLVFLEHGSALAQQDDTLVMPAHRGHRLGLRLKLATLDVIERDHPERSTLHTWTAPDNHAMQRTNRAFGFEPVEVLHEMQRALDA